MSPRQGVSEAGIRHLPHIGGWCHGKGVTPCPWHANPPRHERRHRGDRVLDEGGMDCDFPIGLHSLDGARRSGHQVRHAGSGWLDLDERDVGIRQGASSHDGRPGPV